MDSIEVIKAIKFIKDSCAITSCEHCEFCDRNMNCVLSDELVGAPCEYDIDLLEECIER